MADVIKLIVSTHQGKLFDEICDYVLVKSKAGEFGVLPNHVPVITSFEYGFIKFVRNKEELFLCLQSAVLEFSKNVFTVLAQEAHVGRDMQSAAQYLEEIRKERLEKNRQIETDLAQNEHELLDNIKKVKAGSL